MTGGLKSKPVADYCQSNLRQETTEGETVIHHGHHHHHRRHCIFTIIISIIVLMIVIVIIINCHKLSLLLESRNAL